MTTLILNRLRGLQVWLENFLLNNYIRFQQQKRQVTEQSAPQVMYTGFGETRKLMLEDIAAMTGATVP